MEVSIDLLKSYNICPRKAWLDARQVNGKIRVIEEVEEKESNKNERAVCKDIINQEKPPRSRWCMECLKCNYSESCYI